MSTIDRPISPKRKLQPDELFFINTDYLRKLLSLKSKLNDTAESVSVNSIQKYMCQHKRLNPLAVNKFKLVRREGVEFIQTVLAMDLADMGVLKAGSMVTTKCRLCVVNCFEYLRCKERIKSDSKIHRLRMQVNSMLLLKSRYGCFWNMKMLLVLLVL